MKPIAIHSNYSIDNIELGPLSFENVHLDCDVILKEFVKDLERQDEDNVEWGAHPEHTEIKESYRSIRVLKTHSSVNNSAKPGENSNLHRASVDIVLSRLSDKLTIELQISAHTWLKHLTTLTQFTLFALLFIFGSYVFLSFGGFKSILFSYVQTNLNAPTEEVLGVAQELINAGFTFLHFFTGFNENFPANIAVVFSSCWMVIMGLMGLCWFVIRKLPPQFYSIIFRFLKQPTIKEYEAFVIGHATWVKQILADTLSRISIDRDGVTYR